MSFKDEQWVKRYKAMGDEAETVFRLDADLRRRPYIESGLRRPPFHVGRLPDVERYRPDFLVVPRKEDGEPHFVEVQGVGRDGIVKLKVSKLKALLFWTTVLPVTLFVWNNQTRTVIEADVKVLGAMAVRAKLEGRMGCFDGIHPYYKLEWEALAERFGTRAPRISAARGARTRVGRAPTQSAGAPAQRARAGGRGRPASEAAGGDRGGVLGGAEASGAGPSAGDHETGGVLPPVGRQAKPTEGTQ